jgi:site-specific DNA-adenine methylase
MALNDLLRPNATAQQLDDSTVHDWYRFVLSYPDHLVANLLERFGVQQNHVVLDPFVGTGTTLIECKKKGIHSIGIDANPVTAFASKVKTTWDIDLADFDKRFEALRWAIRGPLQTVGTQYATQLSFDDMLAPGNILAETAVVVDTTALKKLLPKNWISDIPLQKCLIIKEEIDKGFQDKVTDLFRLALANVFVSVSNLGFGPEVYVSKKRSDANVYGTFIDKVRRMRSDLHIIQQIERPGMTKVYTGDARNLTQFVSGPVDFVICSPPYPNEKDYTRITRLELIMLEFMQSKKDLRHVKEGMLRSHTRNVYVADNDAQYVTDIPEIQQLSAYIEEKRIERGATSGFEKLYHRVVVEYFGGMYRVLAELQQIMPVGAKLAFVVGDQMSYFRVPIRTAELLSLIARQKLGYKEKERLLWRTRKATATKMDIEEHILVLERC